MHSHATVRHDEQPETPVLAPGAFGLAVSVVAPRGDEASHAGPILHAAWRLPGRFALLYGGRVPGALRIVAVDLVSGRVHDERCEGGHYVPLPPRSLAAEKEPRVRAISGSLGIDIAAHLLLEPGTYLVFLWIDDVVSEPRIVEVGLGAARGESVATFQAGSASSEPRGSIELRREGARIAGVAYAPACREGRAARVTALALGEVSRHVGSSTALVPASETGAEEWRFAFSLAPLRDPGGRAERLHVLVVADGVLSEVLTVEG